MPRALACRRSVTDGEKRSEGGGQLGNRLKILPCGSSELSGFSHSHLAAEDGLLMDGGRGAAAVVLGNRRNSRSYR